LLIRPPHHRTVLLSHRLNALHAFQIVVFEAVPKLVREVKAKLVHQLGMQQVDIVLLEVVPHDQSQRVIILVTSPLQLKPAQPVEQLSKILLVPISQTVQVRVRSELAGQDATLRSKDLDPAQLELVLFGHDGVVVVVVEEHDA
jgi:hypothetical protein